MEDNLGTQLIYRTTRKIRPTEAGLQFYQHCIKIIGAIDVAWKCVGESENLAAGILRVSAPISFARLYMGEVIATANKIFPELEIELYPDDTVVDLIDGGYDLTIRAGELENSTLVAQRLFTTRMVLCASPECLKKSGRPETLDGLGMYNCLTYRQAGEEAVWRFYDRNSRQTVSRLVRGSFRTDSCDLLCQVALRGDSIVCLPEFVVREYLDDGQLIQLLPELDGMPVPINVVYPPGRSRPEKVKAFVGVLKSALNAIDIDHFEPMGQLA